jgi:hypothetical protein
MVSRQCLVRVLDAIILPTGHSLFQLPELLSRLTENQARAFLPVVQHTDQGTALVMRQLGGAIQSMIAAAGTKNVEQPTH